MLNFCTTCETDVRFVIAYLLVLPFVIACLLLLSVRYRFVYMFFPCVNLIWLFCIFVPLAERMSASLMLIYSQFFPFAITCLLLLSGRYRFVYMFSQCVYLIWLFCIFVPLAKGMSVSLTLIYSQFCPFAITCLLLLSFRYRFVYMFSQCVYLIWLF